MFGISSKPSRDKTWFVAQPMGDLPYDIGDMCNGGQQSYHEEVSDLVHKTSLSISHDLEQSKIFSEVSNFISADKLKLHLEFAVANEIRPVFIAKYIADWHNNQLTTQNYPIYWDDHKGLGELLAKYWANDDPVLILGRRANIYRLIKRTLKPLHNKLLYLQWKMRCLFSIPTRRRREYFIPEGPNILVKYILGINEVGRSDLFWLDSDICSHPNHIVYFDQRAHIPKRKKDISYLAQVLDSMNITYVNLFRQNLPVNNCLTIPRSWKSGPLASRFKSLRLGANTDSEKWLINSLKELLIDVDYWVSVYDQLNVKIHVDISVGTSDHIAQNIALDITNGIRIAWQRSEFLPNFGGYLGWYPCHVFLSWNARANLPLNQNKSRVGSIIIIGISDENLLAHRVQLTSAWYADNHLDQFFTIALFDNMFFRDDLFSKSMIVKLYVEFLQWVIQDDQVAVVNKPKRRLILERLPELKELMYKAESTGRWINLIEKGSNLHSIDYLPIDAGIRACLLYTSDAADE